MNKKHFILFIISIVCFAQGLHAQKAREVLENGVRIKGDRNIFIKYRLADKALRYDLDRSTEDPTHPLNFNNALEDSIIFLPKESGVNVYLMPLNPLNYSYNTSLSVIDDPISKDADEAMGEILDVLDKIKNQSPLVPAGGPQPIINPCDTALVNSKNRVKNITTLLANSKQENIVTLFKRLEAMPFIEEEATRDSIAAIKTSIVVIENHFKKATAAIKHAREQVKTLDTLSRGTCTNAYINISIINSALKELLSLKADQEKRLHQLNAAYKLANKTYQRAKTGGGNGLRWCIPLETIPAKRGKISLYTIKIQEGGYQLSDKNEIVETQAKDIITRTLRIRRHQLFIPERSTGIAYTAFTYNAYGTSTDSTGQQFIADPTEKELNNINVSTMINFNLFLENSPIHPMIQLGLGVNANIPTLLAGVGIRSNTIGTKRLALSTGFAATWVRELDQLKVGDPVKGTDDIEEDLKYKFSLPIKPYFGLQFNF